MPNNKKRAILGPWPGGVNLRDHPQDLPDNQITVGISVDFTDSGAIKPRPTSAFQSTTQGLTVNGTTADVRNIIHHNGVFYALAWNQTTRVVQIIKADSGVDNFDPSLNPGPWLASAGLPTTSSDTKGSLGFSHPLMWVYKGLIYVGGMRNFATQSLSGSVNWGAAAWSMVTGPHTATPEANMASVYATAVCIMKDRLFLAAENFQLADAAINNRIYWSKATDFSVWAAPNGGFVDVGDQRTATLRMIQHNDSLIILKRDGLWRLTWTDDPATDGVLENIMYLVGGLDILSYKGRLYVLTSNGLHELVGGYLVSLSDNIIGPNFATATTDSSVPSINKLFEGGVISFGAAMAASRDRIIIGGAQLSGLNDEWLPFGLGGVTNSLWVQPVYHVDKDYWTLWAPDRINTNNILLQNGFVFVNPTMRPIAADPDTGVVLVNGMSKDDTFVPGLYAYVLPVRARDRSRDATSGPPWSAFETKTYLFGDFFSYKLFHKLKGFIRRPGNATDTLPSMSYQLQRITYDPEVSGGIVSSTDTYTTGDIGASGSSAYEGARYSGFLPFGRKYFRAMRFRFQANKTPTSTGSVEMWEVPYMEIEYGVKPDYPSRVP